MDNYISAKEAKRRIHGTEEIAVLDVREHGQYGEGHLLFASNCPYSRLELEVQQLVPNKSVPCIVYDDGDGIAQRAAERLAHIGYSQVLVLDGGVPSWAETGFGLFKGVNVPSKVLGELAEASYHTPVVSAEQLDEWRRLGRPLLLVDGRPMADFVKMSIPGARCVPNGELLYRFSKLVPDGDTPIVINCAGRTRGLIGAQSLLSAGVSNPVFALENGTQGWVLSGRQLDRGRPSLPLPGVSGQEVELGREVARKFAASHDVPVVNGAEVRAWAREPDRTLYLLDVRMEEEYVAGHVVGARHAPAVQLVQATDEWVAVRNARLVLIDDNGVRAAMAAFWLRQMGHDAVVVRDGLTTMETESNSRPSVLDPRVPVCYADISPEDLLARQNGPAQILDVRASHSYRARRIPRSHWTTRARLDRIAPTKASSIVLVADDLVTAQLAAYDLHSLTELPIHFLRGGLGAWEEAGGAVEPSPDAPTDAEAIDFLRFVHDRHKGNLEASRQYLAWETGLVSQLDERERAEYRLSIFEGAQP